VGEPKKPVLGRKLRRRRTPRPDGKNEICVRTENTRNEEGSEKKTTLTAEPNDASYGKIKDGNAGTSFKEIPTNKRKTQKGLKVGRGLARKIFN